MNPQLDEQALNLAKAIRRAETGSSTDPYNARGASGESGAYQFMPDTWRQWAQQYLGDMNAQMSVENQNRVAYSRIKELKDQGMNPAQIASAWNSGDPDKYKQNWRGTNSQGVQYDTPGYVQKVSQYYNELKTGGTPPLYSGTQPSTPNPLAQTQSGHTVPTLEQTKQSLDSKQGSPQDLVYSPEQRATWTPRPGVAIGDAVNTIRQGMKDTAEHTQTFSQGLGELLTPGDKSLGLGKMLTGLVRATGELGTAALTTAVDTPLRMIPGYDKATEFIGEKVVQPAMDTTGATQYLQENPEVAKNVEAAAGNLAFLPVAGSAFKQATGGLVNRLQNKPLTSEASLRQQSAAELKDALTPSMQKKVNEMDKRRPGLMEKMLERVTPALRTDTSGRLTIDTKEASRTLRSESKRLTDEIDSQIDALDSKILDRAAGPGYTLQNVQARAFAEMLEAYKDSPDLRKAIGHLDDLMEGYRFGKGENLTIRDMQNMKKELWRDLEKKFQRGNPHDLSDDVRKHFGTALMKDLESLLKDEGFDIAKLNEELGELADMQKILKELDERRSFNRPQGLVPSPSQRVTENLMDAALTSVNAPAGIAYNIARGLLPAPSRGGAATKALLNRRRTTPPSRTRKRTMIGASTVQPSVERESRSR